MKRYRVEFTPRARVQLADLEDYIAAEASDEIARNFVQAIIARCTTLDRYPNRGTPRPELGEQLRSMPYRRSTTIVYAVDEDSAIVAIIGIFHGGQDIEARLQAERKRR